MAGSCGHDGWALWKNHWEWWCGNCGAGGSDIRYINDLAAHVPGELWRNDELETA